MSNSRSRSLIFSVRRYLVVGVSSVVDLFLDQVNLDFNFRFVSVDGSKEFLQFFNLSLLVEFAGSVISKEQDEIDKSEECEDDWETNDNSPVNLVVIGGIVEQALLGR